MTTLHDILPAHAARLRAAGLPQPEQDAARIWARLLGVRGEALAAQGDTDVSAKLEAAEALLARRTRFEPMERLLGSVLYRGLTFAIKEGVFCPNPIETDALIDLALSLAADRKTQPLRILDLGTGCGFLLINLLAALPAASGVGIDINEQALEAARENAATNGLSDRATFRVSDWGRDLDEAFDVVICNPPAVPSKDIPRLSPEMALYDPLPSLDGGRDGLSCFRQVARNLRPLLRPDGMAVLYAYSMGQESALFRRHGFDVQTQTNFYGVPYAIIVRHGEGRAPSLWPRLATWFGKQKPRRA